MERLTRRTFIKLTIGAGIAAIDNFALGCGQNIPKPETTRIPVVTSDRCTTPAEFLRPPRLTRESAITYPGGVVVNQAGTVMDLVVRVNKLQSINNEASFDLNSTPETQNITYFFAGSFMRADARSQIAAFIEQDAAYLLLKYCQEQGRASGRMRFSVVSVADELEEVFKRNPRNYSLQDPFWRSALEVQLAIAYLARSKQNTTDPSQIPLETPMLTVQERQTLVRLGLPFAITKLNLENRPPGLQNVTI